MTERPLRATISQKAALFGPTGDVLLLRDGADGPWELPGGRIAEDEAVGPGLRREIREETGLTATVGAPVYTAAWRNDADDGRFVVVYRCQTDDREVTLSDEHDDWRWLPPDEALDARLASSAHRAALKRVIAEQPRRLGGATDSDPDSGRGPDPEPASEAGVDGATDADADADADGDPWGEDGR